MTAHTFPGVDVDKRYRHFVLSVRIGRGGMGEVWRATDTRVGRIVALKILPPHALHSEELRARFKRECMLAAQIEHRNVVPIYDFDFEGDQPYISMRYIPGTNLDAALDGKPLPPHRALSVIDHVACALDAAHAAHLHHRDVKPSNILLQPDGRHGANWAWLCDWGIAAPIDVSDAQVTRTGQIVGTAAYIAPERLEKKNAGHRADLYSLTVVLYECLTGQRPFTGFEWEVLQAHLKETPPDLPTTLPPGLNDVIKRGMAKDENDRYDSGEDLVEDARRALRGEPVTVTGHTFPGLRDTIGESRGETTAPEPPAAEPTRGDSRWIAAPGGAIAGAAGAVALLAAGQIDATALSWVGPVLAVAGGLLGWAAVPRKAPARDAGPSDPTHVP